MKDFLVGRNSRCEGFPGGKEFPVGRNSWWKKFQVERFPDDKDFPVIRISRRKKISLWKVFPNSRGEGFSGGKNFLVGKMFTFITKSFLGQPKSKNRRNFSPAAGIYWLIKLSVLSLSHEIQLLKIHKKLPSMLAFINKSFLGHPKSKNNRNFSPAAGIYWLIKLSVLS